MKSSGRQLALDITLREDATFDLYVGDAGQRLRLGSPVSLVWGAPGSGRSHLLQACCHAETAQGGRAIYLCELSKLSPEVLDGLESLSLICLDDIQDVIGQPNWEEALFHLLNSVRDQGKLLVMSSDQPARQLPVRLKDLQSRLLAAVAIETDELDDNRKLQVICSRAGARGFRLDQEVGRYIMSRAARDMGSLMALLERLETESLRQHKKLTIPFVRQVLGL